MALLQQSRADKRQGFAEEWAVVDVNPVCKTLPVSALQKRRWKPEFNAFTFAASHSYVVMPPLGKAI